jgi:hypothetical protein
MRSPNGPLFTTYELVAVLAFVLAAIAVGGLRLIY